MDFKIKPWKHQLEAIQKAQKLTEFGLFFEVGTGKTLTAIHIMLDKYKVHRRQLKTIIFCPPIVIENWKRELKANSDLTDKQIIPLTGSQVDRSNFFDFYKDRECVFITNYESLLMPALHARFMLWEPEIIIWDELHKLKNPTSKRSKLAAKLADVSLYRLGLTGTPVLNQALDLYSQYRALDCGKTFGKNFFTFRQKFFFDKNAGMPRGSYFPDWHPKASCYEEIKQLISKSSMVAKKSECLDLPPLIKKKIFVELSTEQKRMYTQMKKDFIAYIKDKQAAVANIAITKALRLQQIVSGFVNLEDDTTHIFKGNPRKDALKELLESMQEQHKIIVWAVFRDNYRDIREVCDALKIKYVEVHGDVANKDKYTNVDLFNNDPTVRVLLGHPGSGGIGINLVSSDVSIFYSRNFSLEQDLQAEARNYRGGSERHEKVTRIDLVAKETIDEQVIEALSNKVSIGENILMDMIIKENKQGEL